MVIRLSRLRAVNAYLVREDDGFTVIDTMLPGSERAIIGAAERRGAPIRRILLTHAHNDHVGSLDALAGALREAEVLIGAREARLLAGDMTLDPDEPQDKLRGGYPQVDDAPDAHARAGRSRRLAGGPCRPGSHARPDRALRPARRDALLRRRLLDDRQRGHEREGRLAVAPARRRDLAQADRARVGPAAA